VSQSSNRFSHYLTLPLTLPHSGAGAAVGNGYEARTPLVIRGAMQDVGIQEGRGKNNGTPATSTATLLYALVVRRRRGADEVLLCSMRLPFPSAPLA